MIPCTPWSPTNSQTSVMAGSFFTHADALYTKSKGRRPDTSCQSRTPGHTRSQPSNFFRPTIYRLVQLLNRVGNFALISKSFARIYQPENLLIFQKQNSTLSFYDFPLLSCRYHLNNESIKTIIYLHWWLLEIVLKK